MSGPPEQGAADEPVGRHVLDDAAAERGEVADEVIGYAPLVDYDALDAQTVVLELSVPAGTAGAIASELREDAVAVFELTGRPNVFAVCRFTDDERRERRLAELATDDRVDDLTVSVVLRTVVEGDTRGLL